MMIIAILIGLVSAAITPLSECGKARATYYDDSGENLACVLGNNYPSSIYRVAPNEKFYLESNQCGICYEAIGELGSVVLMVSDLCPASGNAEHCSGDHVHFDVGQSAYPLLCKKETGVCDITYRMVSCNVEGNIRLKTKSGVSEWWLGFHIQNYVIGIKSVSITYGTTTKQLTRTSGNYWQNQAEGSSMKTPITITVTSIAGDTQTITMNTIESDKIYEGNGQFKVPKDMFFNPEDLKKTTTPASVDECCSLPDNSVIYHDSIESFWNVGYGSYSDDTSVKKEGKASMKFTWAQWNGMNIGSADHRIIKKMYKGIQMYVKAPQGSTFSLWHLKHQDKQKKVTVKTNNWELVSISFDELSFGDEYFNGIEMQSSTAGTVVFYFDEIKLVRNEDVCFQYCSDHESTCSKYTPGGNGGNHNNGGDKPTNQNNSGVTNAILLMIMCLIVMI